MPGCANGPCGRGEAHRNEWGMAYVDGQWRCYLCEVMPRLFPPLKPCPEIIDPTTLEPCRYIAEHPGPCRGLSGRAKKVVSKKAATRDGVSKKKSRDPRFTPRKRVGPHR